VVYVPSSAQFLDDLRHELATKEWWYRLQKEGAHVKYAKLISKFTGEEVTEIVRQDSEYHLRKLVRVGSEDRPVYVRLSDQGLGVYRLALLAMRLAAHPSTGLAAIQAIKLDVYSRLIAALERSAREVQVPLLVDYEHVRAEGEGAHEVVDRVISEYGTRLSAVS